MISFKELARAVCSHIYSYIATTDALSRTSSKAGPVRRESLPTVRAHGGTRDVEDLSMRRLALYGHLK
jgi:hypothetical protein